MDEMELTLKICQGYRPNINELKIPQLLKDLIKKCWDAEPEKRPTAGEVEGIIDGWIDYDNGCVKEDTQFYLRYQEIEQEYNTFSQNTPYQIHPTATLTSKMIDTKQITKLLSKEVIGSSEIPNMADLLDKFANTSVADNNQNTKQLTAEQVLNQGNETELRQEFQNYQQLQIQIEQPPK
ncbi:15537_t:CDS:2 [Entrophospora sp. SA101]|nr:12400_t:CDS:2 [Entrophospora sp. SA101]CAJ0761335.1 15537_t:CDS:2 [Entrophospora sp. SA101]CAJ0855670.1 17277_t:CDS:2 [Entrophospora sp. SA101]